MTSRKKTGRVVLKRKEVAGVAYFLEFPQWEAFDDEGDRMYVDPVTAPYDSPGAVAYVSGDLYLSREKAIELRDLLTEIIDATA